MAPSIGDMRVLVVEDERAIADFIKRGLEAEGYSVACAHDGIDGELKALSGDFELVLLDVLLPGKNGHRGADEDSRDAAPTCR